MTPSKHTPGEPEWNVTRIIVGHDSNHGAIPAPGILIDALERFTANRTAYLVLALKAAEQELEANKLAMIGPEWAAQRTATGGALLAVSRAIMQAEARP